MNKWEKIAEDRLDRINEIKEHETELRKEINRLDDIIHKWRDIAYGWRDAYYKKQWR